MARLGILCSLIIIGLLVLCAQVEIPPTASAAYTPYVRKVARITFTGTTPVIDNELKGSWLTSCSRSAAGNITCGIKTNIFPARSKPICFCNAETYAAPCNIIPASATSFNIRVSDLTGTLANVLGGLLGQDTVFVVACEYTEQL